MYDWRPLWPAKGRNFPEKSSLNKWLSNAEVYERILGHIVSKSIQGEDFTEVRDDESTLTFLIDLGYKGSLYKHPSMYVDLMHQPWRTLATIINKCLSGKSTSNDRLRKSKIDILRGMFYKENCWDSRFDETK
ncbi:hypothetical protein Tco_0454951 [Tanacetum coccineum]